MPWCSFIRPLHLFIIENAATVSPLAPGKCDTKIDAYSLSLVSTDSEPQWNPNNCLLNPCGYVYGDLLIKVRNWNKVFKNIL